MLFIKDRKILEEMERRRKEIFAKCTSFFADYHTLSDCRQNLIHSSPASKNTYKIRAITSYFLALLLDSFCPAPCSVCIRVIWDQVLDCSSQMFRIIRLQHSGSSFVISIKQNIKDPAGMNISFY